MRLSSSPACVVVQEFNQYPQEYNDVNVGGTVALMAAVRDVGVPWLCWRRRRRSTASSRASLYTKTCGPTCALCTR